MVMFRSAAVSGCLILGGRQWVTSTRGVPYASARETSPMILLSLRFGAGFESTIKEIR